MKSKDQILLESLYQKVLLREHDVEAEDEIKKEENQKVEKDPTNTSEVNSYEDVETSKTSPLTPEEELKEIERIEKMLNGKVASKEAPQFKDAVTANEGKLRHGVQINEAKKKVNPWAIENSIEKKYGKHFGKKKKESIVKKIKKNAKKYGEEITSKPVKKKTK